MAAGGGVAIAIVAEEAAHSQSAATTLISQLESVAERLQLVEATLTPVRKVRAPWRYVAQLVQCSQSVLTCREPVGAP